MAALRRQNMEKILSILALRCLQFFLWKSLTNENAEQIKRKIKVLLRNNYFYIIIWLL